jgi:hypothetical protein
MVKRERHLQNSGEFSKKIFLREFLAIFKIGICGPPHGFKQLRLLVEDALLTSESAVKIVDK